MEIVICILVAIIIYLVILQFMDRVQMHEQQALINTQKELLEEADLEIVNLKLEITMIEKEHLELLKQKNSFVILKLKIENVPDLFSQN